MFHRQSADDICHPDAVTISTGSQNDDARRCIRQPKWEIRVLNLRETGSWAVVECEPVRLFWLGRAATASWFRFPTFPGVHR